MSFEGSVFIREARRSLIEYDACTFKDVFLPDDRQRENRHRTYDLHLLFNHREKNRRVKSVGTLKNHARELTLSDIHQNLMFRVLCINAGSVSAG